MRKDIITTIRSYLKEDIDTITNEMRQQAKRSKLIYESRGHWKNSKNELFEWDQSVSNFVISEKQKMMHAGKIMHFKDFIDRKKKK